MVVQGPSPGPRYAHTLTLVVNRFLVIMGGNDGKTTLPDCWALDTSEKPYHWQKVQARMGGFDVFSANVSHTGFMVLMFSWLNT